MYNPYQASNPFGRPPDFGAFGAPGAPPGMGPPGMAAPGTAPPGVQQANVSQPGRPGGFPPNFQPPANMPNINFSAPVIRLGTTGPSKPSTPIGGASGRDTDSPSTTGRRAGLGANQGMEAQRQALRESMLQLQPPTKEEILRTLFIGNITEGAGGDDGIESILRSAGSLKRWTRATDADSKACTFGFAEYEDPESLATAVEVLRDVEVPVKRQTASGQKAQDTKVEKSKLLVVVDDTTVSYLDQYKSSRSDQDSITSESRIEHAKSTLSAILHELENPSTLAQGAEKTLIDQDGDTAMQESDGQNAAEIVTIPLTVDDELSDIPAEMRETVAKEIAAFRDRSNRRDMERLKREEEIESMERARNRPNRLASPPVSAPSGPAGGANGIPVGPRDRGVPNAPAGPKGFHQVPKDYQKGVTFVNGTGINGASTAGWIDREDEDSDASDEELERRRQAKKEAELEKQYLDQERRWLNRERSRTAAVEREKAREKEEEERKAIEKEAMAKRLREWDDDVETTKKAEEYYLDRSLWIRNRAGFRTREANLDELDRAAEEREKAKSQQQREQARGMADDFLARQAEELESRNRAPSQPQRFKLSLGAAAQKAHTAASTRRTAAEVEGLLEDEEDIDTTAKRTLVPIKFDTAAEASALTDEERKQAQRQLAADIPSDKDGLWKWEVKWDYVDETVIGESLKPFVEKKIMEYLGVQEQMLVDVVEEHIRKRGSPQELVEHLEGALDEEAEVLVKKLWRMIIFISESDKRGLR
ncbi:MAG: hypothetical protein M1834_007806 [Cirrosporium novae-zelandiae]|nr:MAG: hypothetical protein M1834_007806 [Cirrosporium novae-zelandiae]